jgi:hypothetical protein
MRQALERGDWKESARLLREEWINRKKNAPGITTPLIDRLVEVTRRAGSVGAKVCGAGGGGCVFFLVERGAKERVAAAITAAGAKVLPVHVAPKGVSVRIVRRLTMPACRSATDRSAGRLYVFSSSSLRGCSWWRASTCVRIWIGSALGTFVGAVVANVVTLRIYEGRRLADIGFIGIERPRAICYGDLRAGSRRHV